jgi:hypothetical protein
VGLGLLPSAHSASGPNQDSLFTQPRGTTHEKDRDSACAIAEGSPVNEGQGQEVQTQKEGEKVMAAPNVPENAYDVSAKMTETSSNKHQHPVNLGVHPGLAKPGDWEPGGPEVPARAERERVNPADAAKQRRTPLIDVTAITPAGSGNHGAVPPPKKL